MIKIAFGKKALNLRKKDQEMQSCPLCGYPIGILAGSKDAICLNCGFKDPCCE